MAAILETPMIHKPSALLAGIAVTTLLMLCACSSLPMPDPTSLFGAGQIAPQAGDPCASERAAFAGSQSYFGSEIASRAFMGGVGKVASDLMTRIGSGQTTNLTAGLSADAFRGAQAGYLSAIADQSSGSASDMVRRMDSDLGRESEKVDALHSTFVRLQSCRFLQARLIKSRARNGQLAPDEARTQLATERRLFNEELAKAQQSDKNMKSRDDQFQYAAQELDRTGVAPVATAQRKHAADVATVTLPRKQEAFASAVSDAEVRSKSDLSDDISSS